MGPDGILVHAEFDEEDHEEVASVIRKEFEDADVWVEYS